MTYTVEFAKEWGAGTGVNGYGKRAKVEGYYVVSPEGRRVRAFSINSVKTAAIQSEAAVKWAAYLTENMK